MGISPPTGASVNISCEFVRPAGKVGEELYSIGEVVKLGESSPLVSPSSLLPSTSPLVPFRVRLLLGNGSGADSRPNNCIHKGHILR
jgi:hypothetical protein